MSKIRRDKKYFTGRILYISVLTVLILSFCGCESSKVEYVGRAKRTEIMTNTILTSGTLSYKAQQYLACNALADEYKENPEKVIKKLAEYVENPDSSIITDTEGIRFSLFVLMELCMQQALKSNKENALKYWMSTCFYSYKYVFDESIDPPINKYYTMLGLVMALHFYNISLSEISEYLINKKDLWESEPVFETVTGKVKFEGLVSDMLWPPKIFEEFMIALDYLPSKKLLVHSFSTGIGIPMIGIKNNDSKFAVDKELTMLNKTYPFIFVLKFNSFKYKNNCITATPELFDGFDDEYTDIDGKQIPLYKDYSVFIGKSLESQKYIKGIKYMFDPGKMGDMQELYFISPYDPDKIPVVLVHGLMSEPRTWAETLNILYNNRKIRTNYQFIFYSYPTGLPAIMNASKFRQDLLKFRKKYDPDNKNPKMKYMVVVGHSMGGLLTRMVVQDSKDDYLLNKFLGDNPEDTELTKSQKALLDSIFVFEALPFVRRVVLIAAPHRGAEMATYFYSKIGSYITSIPASLAQESINILQGVDRSKISKDFKILGIPTGIADLSPDRGMKRYTVDLPFSKNVVIYSIIGDKDEAGKKGGTDGIVTYESSHLDNVEREVIIKSGHDEIKKAACAKEITKILFENLDEYNTEHAKQ